MCAMTGRSTTGTIGFGISNVSGRRRVPSPAARTMAFIGAEPSERGATAPLTGPRPSRSGFGLAGPARQVRALLVSQFVELDPHRVELQPRDFVVDRLGQRLHAGLQVVAFADQALGGQGLAGGDHAPDPRPG